MPGTVDIFVDPRVRMREALRALVVADPEQWHEPSLLVFRNRLLDQTGSDARPLADLLLEAWQRGWRDTLPRERVEPARWDALAAPFVMRWSAERFIQPDMAQWATECWALALGVIAPEQLRIVPPRAPRPTRSSHEASATARNSETLMAPGRNGRPPHSGARGPRSVASGATTRAAGVRRGRGTGTGSTTSRGRYVPNTYAGLPQPNPKLVWGLAGSAVFMYLFFIGRMFVTVRQNKLAEAAAVKAAAVEAAAVEAAAVEAAAVEAAAVEAAAVEAAAVPSNTAPAAEAAASTTSSGASPVEAASPEVSLKASPSVSPSASAEVSPAGVSSTASEPGSGAAPRVVSGLPTGVAGAKAAPTAAQLGYSTVVSTADIADTAPPIAAPSSSPRVRAPGVPSVTSSLLDPRMADRNRMVYVQPPRRAEGASRPVTGTTAVPSLAFDEVFLNNGTAMRGRVQIVRAGTVIFVDARTGLRHEIRKDSIDRIITEYGAPVRFRVAGSTSPRQSKATVRMDNGPRGRGVAGSYLIRYAAAVAVGSPECTDLWQRPPDAVDRAIVRHVAGDDTLRVSFEGGDSFLSNMDGDGYFASTFRIVPDQARTSTALTTRLTGQFKPSGELSMQVSIVFFRRMRTGRDLTCTVNVDAVGRRETS